jgi:multisubunit Na+/H+ antiporter MnhC subunit
MIYMSGMYYMLNENSTNRIFISFFLINYSIHLMIMQIFKLYFLIIGLTY